MLKKIVVVLVAAFVLSAFCSCGRDISAVDFMTDFASSYPLEGKLYHSMAKKSESGYISRELFCRIYACDGEIPDDFAIYLNSRPERGEECGIFKVTDGDTEAVIELCRKRIKLLSDRNTEGLVLTSGEYVFYSTLGNSERARELFYRLIK